MLRNTTYMTYINSYMFRYQGAIIRELLVPKHVGVYVCCITKCICGIYVDCKNWRDVKNIMNTSDFIL